MSYLLNLYPSLSYSYNFLRNFSPQLQYSSVKIDNLFLESTKNSNSILDLFSFCS